ncbi:MAG: hypothetical protein M1829_003252 [Trizodia sp. TS-e1964]|nr:MAG: hypothetical protein M1829_003252 [Trizodia sp. TS-e1964]
MPESADPLDATVLEPTFVSSIGTPINLLLLALLIFTLYLKLRPTPPPPRPAPVPAVEFKTFTPSTLLPFTGANNQPILLAIRGRVFDVSRGRLFYGPSGPYANFAGRDASRGLACGSFEEDMLTHDLDGPLDPLEGLSPDQLEALRGWEETFESKYIVVGRLVAAGDIAKSS